jgi:hypothetical protein
MVVDNAILSDPPAARHRRTRRKEPYLLPRQTYLIGAETYLRHAETYLRGAET